jgi:hypothetical protein
MGTARLSLVATELIRSERLSVAGSWLELSIDTTGWIRHEGSSANL